MGRKGPAPSTRPSPAGAAPASDEVPLTGARSVALVGHRSSGKTSLAERLLHAGGVVRQAGRVDDGSCLLDDDAESRARRATWQPSFAWLPWGRVALHLVDTPGSEALHDVRRAASAGADGLLLVLSAADGVEAGAAAVCREAVHDDRPLLLALSRCDRASWRDARAAAEAACSLAQRRLVWVTLPWHDDAGQLVGVVDVIARRMLRYDVEAGDGRTSAEPVPAWLAPRVDEVREALFEAVALHDDGPLLEAYLDALTLTPEAAWSGLAKAVADGAVAPAFATSAPGGVGAAPLLDGLERLLPDPAGWTLPADTEGEPAFVAQWVATRVVDGERVAVLRVWRGPVTDNTLWTHAGSGETVRVRKLYRLRGPRRAKAGVAVAGELVATWDPLPGVPGDAFTDGARVPLALPAARPSMAWLWATPAGGMVPGAWEAALAGLDATLAGWRAVDPSVRVELDAARGGVRLSGGDDVGLRRFAEDALRVAGVRAELGPPPLACLERPRSAASGVHGRVERCRGDEVDAFGEVWLDVQPGPWPDDPAPLRFTARVDEDDLPARFVPAVAAGVTDALAQGPTAGFPVVGVEAALVGGAYDAIASEPEHLREAAASALAEALEAVGTELWEPVHEVHVVVPAEVVGAVLALAAGRRGRVTGLQVDDIDARVTVRMPEAELGTFGAALAVSTAGRGWFVARPSHHERVPDELVAAIARRAPARQPGGAGVGSSARAPRAARR